MPHKTNWYAHLVNQSRTDHIYDLIHEYLDADWEPNHDLDFVVVRKRNLPSKLKALPNNHQSSSLPHQAYCFPGDDYILLDGKHLTEYLEAAKEMQFVTDFEDRDFIELFFTYQSNIQEPPQSVVHPSIPNPLETTPETLVNKEDALGIAYNLLTIGNDRALALQYAEIGKQFLDAHKIEVGDPTKTLQEVCRQMIGYNIVAMVYVWNNQIDKAAAVDKIYLHNPWVWDELETVIKPYLEMLMAKKQEDYLQFIFQDKSFQKRFQAHYEVYISMFLNPNFEWTKSLMHEFVAIINRVNNSYGQYV